MNLSNIIAIENYALLRSLQPFTRLIANKDTGKLTIDDRWLSSARRYANGDSRHDIIEPINLTFKYAISIVPEEEVEETINHVNNTLSQTYPYEGFKFIVPITITKSPAIVTPNEVKVEVETDSIRRRNNAPDLRIPIDLDGSDDFSNPDILPPVDDFECSLYQVFPCMKKLMKWINDGLEDKNK